MDKQEFITSLMERLQEIILDMDDWVYDDMFFLAQEYAQQLHDELESLTTNS